MIVAIEGLHPSDGYDGRIVTLKHISMRSSKQAVGIGVIIMAEAEEGVDNGLKHGSFFSSNLCTFHLPPSSRKLRRRNQYHPQQLLIALLLKLQLCTALLLQKHLLEFLH